MPQVVTANRLSDGIVVFLAPGGGWAEFLSQAAIFDDPQALQEGLGIAGAALSANEVVDVFAFDVIRAPEGPQPVHIRDRIRSKGPTVHPDHGKQAVSG